jgi:cyclin B
MGVSMQVHLKFKLMMETLYLTTNLIDRYLSVRSVSRKNLQLVGVTALLLAAKYEEIWAPEVNDFVHISDNAYTREQILDMEKTMLNTLKFNLTVPTPYVFVARCLKAAAAEREVFIVSLHL